MAESREKEMKSSHLVYVAIDFGTTFTGFAHGLRSDIEKGMIYTSFYDGNNVLQKTVKTPTVLLLDKNKDFHSFGYNAEDKFQDLDEEELDSWFFFERFKMKLYETKRLSRETRIKDHRGKEHNALGIFSIVISHLKETVLKKITTEKAGVQLDDILWILTVPAIWSDAARQFMREAANKANIDDEQLKLVLEPEAASSYVNTLKFNRIVKLDGTATFEEFPVGEQYIVADLGGGTADLAVHEVLEDRNLREIARSDGDAHGGLVVDKAYEKFLVSLLGVHSFSALGEEGFKLKKDFEIKKRQFDMTKTNEQFKITMSKFFIEESLGESFEAKMKEAEKKYPGKIKYKADKIVLMLSFEIMKSFFDEAVDCIIKFVEDLRNSQMETVGRITALVMVGGFSESLYVQQRIKQAIQGLRVFVPPDASLAVLKGAVILGYNPKSITERIARFTYGFSNARLFEPNSDPESLKVIQCGEELCSSIFCKILEKGQILKVGDRYSEKVIHKCSSLIGMLMPLATAVYRSDKKDPKYTTEEDGSERVGLIIGFPPNGGWLPVSVVEESLVIGESEFTVIVKDLLKDYVMESKLDFLSEDDLSITGSENICSIM